MDNLSNHLRAVSATLGKVTTCGKESLSNLYLSIDYLDKMASEIDREIADQQTHSRDNDSDDIVIDLDALASSKEAASNG